MSSGSLDYRQRSRTQSSFLPPPVSSSSSPAGQLPPATLVVGDSTFLLTYRLARDEATGLASVTFLNDVKARKETHSDRQTAATCPFPGL